MGSSQSDQKSNNKSTGNNFWLQYEQQLAKDELSEIPPFYKNELAYLEELFKNLDKKNLNSIQLKDFDEIMSLRQHLFFDRIKQLFEQQIKKIKAKRVNFELFLHLLEIFQVKTEVEQKLKYVFKILDWDRNLKIDEVDLVRYFKLIMKGQLINMTQEDYKRIASETMLKFGFKEEIKIEQLSLIIPEDEIKEIMSFPFDRHFS